MYYACSLGNGSDFRLFSQTGDIIHVSVHEERGIRTRTDVKMFKATKYPEAICSEQAHKLSNKHLLKMRTMLSQAKS